MSVLKYRHFIFMAYFSGHEFSMKICGYNSEKTAEVEELINVKHVDVDFRAEKRNEHA